MMQEQWNPRYLAYVIATGATHPDEALERDRDRWPGGCMWGFILWIKEQWDAFGAATRPRPIKNREDHDEFDSWLADRLDAPLTPTPDTDA